MDVFEFVLCLLLGGVGLALLAPRLRVPWPVLLAMSGVALAVMPGTPALALDPRLALALFVAPALLDAAFDASPRDLRDNWVPVGSLVLFAVGVTVAAVAVVARVLDPAMPWPAAVALGAIVAPPDAAAAAAVLRQVRMPHRLQVILEGESLLNDATALLVYRVAIRAAAGTTTSWSAPLTLLAALGGVVLGHVLARAYLAVAARVEDGPAAVVLQFLGTFGAWLLADALGISAVLTVVAYAMTLAQHTPGRTSARHRRASYAVWEVAIFVLNLLAFILVGLQLRGILTRLDGRVWPYAVFGVAVLATVVLARFLWVMSANTAIRWKHRRFGVRLARPLPPPTISGGLVISWCGMRGIVTLAAALALPERFPERDLITFAAFCVVVGTLVLQGLTLRPLLGALTLPPDESVETELALARTEAARAALASLAEHGESPAGHLLAEDYRARMAGDEEPGPARNSRAALQRHALAAERRCLVALRAQDRIGDDAFHRLEEELDWAEANERPL